MLDAVRSFAGDGHDGRGRAAEGVLLNQFEAPSRTLMIHVEQSEHLPTGRAEVRVAAAWMGVISMTVCSAGLSPLAPTKQTSARW